MRTTFDDLKSLAPVGLIGTGIFFGEMMLRNTNWIPAPLHYLGYVGVFGILGKGIAHLPGAPIIIADIEKDMASHITPQVIGYTQYIPAATGLVFALISDGMSYGISQLNKAYTHHNPIEQQSELEQNLYNSDQEHIAYE